MLFISVVKLTQFVSIPKISFTHYCPIFPFQSSHKRFEPSWRQAKYVAISYVFTLWPRARLDSGQSVRMCSSVRWRCDHVLTWIPDSGFRMRRHCRLARSWFINNLIFIFAHRKWRWQPSMRCGMGVYALAVGLWPQPYAH